ncbi:MAG: MGMT family protein [Verrucomicrobiae bacterium]|nr:MGMT family protein [Verrucomicrobiae bacterium]
MGGGGRRTGVHLNQTPGRATPQESGGHIRSLKLSCGHESDDLAHQRHHAGCLGLSAGGESHRLSHRPRPGATGVVARLIHCHRVIRQSGVLGGYRWGENRKRAILGWEAVRMAAALEN